MCDIGFMVIFLRIYPPVSNAECNKRLKWQKISHAIRIVACWFTFIMILRRSSSVHPEVRVDLIRRGKWNAHLEMVFRLEHNRLLQFSLRGTSTTEPGTLLRQRTHHKIYANELSNRSLKKKSKSLWHNNAREPLNQKNSSTWKRRNGIIE